MVGMMMIVMSSFDSLMEFVELFQLSVMPFALVRMRSRVFEVRVVESTRRGRDESTISERRRARGRRWTRRRRTSWRSSGEREPGRWKGGRRWKRRTDRGGGLHHRWAVWNGNHHAFGKLGKVWRTLLLLRQAARNGRTRTDSSLMRRRLERRSVTRRRMRWMMTTEIQYDWGSGRHSTTVKR